MSEELIENQNQHYVPQYYFRQFSETSKSICMLMRNGGKSIEHVPIKKQSSANEFYGTSEVEKEITKFDTKYFENIEPILKSKSIASLSKTQIDILIENISFQRHRTINARNKNAPAVNLITDFILPQIEENNEEWPEELNNALYNSLKSTFENQGDKIWQQNILYSIKDKKDKISDLKITLLKNETNKPFIFSDSPVIFSNYALKEYSEYSITNENSAGCLIFYPLNSNLLILLYDENAYSFNFEKPMIINISEESDVNNINKLQIHESKNSIYFSDFQFKTYVKKLWKEEQKNLSTNKSKIHDIPVYLPNKDSLSNQYVLIEDSPNFYPELSFLKIKPTFLDYPYSIRFKYLSESSLIPK